MFFLVKPLKENQFKKPSLCMSVGAVVHMVLVLNGYTEKGAHVLSRIGHLNSVRHFSRLKIVANLKSNNNFFPLTDAQQV